MIKESKSNVCVSCAHNGYKHLPGRVIHRRKWTLGARTLIVTDTIKGQYNCAVARFHLHPEVDVKDHAGLEKLMLPGGRIVQMEVENATVMMSPGSFHPEFGLSIGQSVY